MLKILAERWRQGHRNTDLKPPRPAQRGEVAERGEAGEGLSRFMLKDPGLRHGGGDWEHDPC